MGNAMERQRDTGRAITKRRERVALGDEDLIPSRRPSDYLAGRRGKLPPLQIDVPMVVSSREKRVLYIVLAVAASDDLDLNVTWNDIGYQVKVGAG